MTAATVTTAGREASLQILTQGYTPAGPATVILMDSSHDFTGDPFMVSDVSGDEAVATGYARAALAFDPIHKADDGTVSQSSQPLSFGLVGGAVNAKIPGCYIFEDSGNDATSPVTACVTFVEEQQTDGTELILRPITWVWNVTIS